MKLYRTNNGNYVEEGGNFYRVAESNWDALVAHEDLSGYLGSVVAGGKPAADFAAARIEAPIVSQEVWAAGVTYYRSRSARMAEAKDAGGGDFYDRVYTAERPELFFKATASRVVGHGGNVRIRSDAKWSVPEPELTLVINPRGQIIGYTVGNDMSSRDIEGENPLYLPQAKVYDGSCALGPCVLVTGERSAGDDSHPAGDPARRPGRVPQRDDACRAEARAGSTGLISISRERFPGRRIADDRNRHCAAGRFHAPAGRQGFDHYRPHRHA